MTCCNKKAPLDHIYVPLSKRLIEFGAEVSGEQLMREYSTTFMWIFTFADAKEICEECNFKLAAMNDWFMQYGLFTDPTHNVKWIYEDEPEKNLIYKEMGFTKTPMHVFCDSSGKIIDIIMGFPTPEWLEKYILPIIRKDVPFYE